MKSVIAIVLAVSAMSAFAVEAPKVVTPAVVTAPAAVAPVKSVAKNAAKPAKSAPVEVKTTPAAAIKPASK